MPNRLSDCSSPYLLQHAENPVDWYPWGPEALEKARREQKPIFLSIGYSACHWCHVMKRESFQHQETADIMNKLYVNIKVDREERPDLDKLYIQALMLIIGGAGWPLNVWLTPDLKPFHGATYLPHVPRPGVPSLAQQLLYLADAWKKNREQVEASAERVTLVLKKMSDVEAPPLPPGSPWLDTAAKGCKAQYDKEHGGFGRAPKFPQPQILRFLLSRGRETEDGELLDLVDHSAQAMARGGLFDQLGGGFHRYSVDNAWTVPHFEKMLYDNAQLCQLYAELYAQTETPFYKWVVESLVGWLKRDMMLENGGICSSTDAESEDEEGRAFLWTQEQLAEILEEDELRIFCLFFGVTPQGNFGGRNVLTRRRSVAGCAEQLGWEPERASALLKSARAKAFEKRGTRIQPGRDEKVVACWAAQMTSALCSAARLSDAQDAREPALRSGEFLLSHFTVKNEDGTYPRIWSAGKAYGQAFSEDLGSLVLAFFDLHELTGEKRWLDKGLELFDELSAEYWDQEKRLTAVTHPATRDILIRPYVFEDSPTPSGNSLFLECARRRHELVGNEDSPAALRSGLEKVAPLACRAPTSFGALLHCAQLQQEEAREQLNA